MLMFKPIECEASPVNPNVHQVVRNRFSILWPFQERKIGGTYHILYIGLYIHNYPYIIYKVYLYIWDSEFLGMSPQHMAKHMVHDGSSRYC